MSALCNVVLAVRKCQPCLYLLKGATRMCAMSCLWRLRCTPTKYIILFSSYTFCSSLDGERIYRPCPYCIHRALFLQPRFALLTWLWLRVTVHVLVKKKEGAKWKRFDDFSLFFFFFHFLSSVSCWQCCPTCFCTRVGKQLDYALLHLQKSPVAKRSQTGRWLPSRQCAM